MLAFGHFLLYQKSMLIGFLCIFLGVMGVGIVIPLTPYLARFYGASAFEVGLLMGCYPLAQLVFAPIWGSLSDKWGRRNIMVITLLGVGVGYIVFSFAKSFEMLMVGRLVCGIFAANIALALAYMSDLSSEKDRSKSFAILGLALCLGFIFGPVIGGVLVYGGESLLGFSGRTLYSVPSLIASGLYGLASVLAFLYMKKTVVKARKKLSFNSIRDMFREKPLLYVIFLILFLKGFALAHFEASLFLLLKEHYHWPLSKSSASFALVGICMAISQGWLVRAYVSKVGERFFFVLGLGIAAVGLLGMAKCSDLVGFFTSIALFSVAYGLAQPTGNALASSLADSSYQGLLFGLLSSVAALSRTLSPPLGGYFYDLWPHLPFYVASLLMVACVIVTLFVYKRLPNLQQKS